MKNPVSKRRDWWTANERNVFDRMEREMNRLMEEFFPKSARSGYRDRERDWDIVSSQEEGRSSMAPACDLEDKDNYYLLSVDLPGMDKKDINVEIKNGYVTVSGERKSEKKESGNKRTYTERNYGYFSRTFAIPDDVKEDDIEANYYNGVLHIMLPKSEAVTGKAIEVKEGKTPFFEKLMNTISGKSDKDKRESSESSRREEDVDTSSRVTGVSNEEGRGISGSEGIGTADTGTEYGRGPGRNIDVGGKESSGTSGISGTGMDTNTGIGGSGTADTGTDYGSKTGGSVGIGKKGREGKEGTDKDKDTGHTKAA